MYCELMPRLIIGMTSKMLRDKSMSNKTASREIYLDEQNIIDRQKDRNGL